MINNLKDLETLLLLCRKEGVTEINFGDIHIKLGEKPKKKSRKEEKENSSDVQPSDDEIMFWSAQ